MLAFGAEEHELERRACRLAVTVLGVRGIGSSTPLLKFQAEEDSALLVAEATYDPATDTHSMRQNHAFDIKDENAAEFTISMGAKGAMGVKKFGSTRPFSVQSLLDDDKLLADPVWLEVGNVGIKKTNSREGPIKLPSRTRSKGNVGLESVAVLVQAKAAYAPEEQKISIFVGTWNVGNSPPAEDLSPWLGPKPTDVDATPRPGAKASLIVIGSQECEYPPRPGFSTCQDDWVATIRNHYGKGYSLVKAVYRGQMRLVVLAAAKHLPAVTDVDSSSEATGIGHVLANKGAVCVSLQFWDTSFCFVTCHLAAHEGACAIRNDNYKEIVRNMRPGLASMDILNQFHHVVWCGDLNYRLSFNDEQASDVGSTDAALSEDQEDEDEIAERADSGKENPLFDMVLEKVNKKEFADLLEKDELRREIKNRKAFYRFKEADINFPPTFKVKKGVGLEYNRKRLPAWCDRVLWRSLPGAKMSNTSYSAAMSIISSDHKPVSATFNATTYALPVRLSGDEGSRLNPGGGDDDMRWHVQFTKLSGTKLRAGDPNGFSDPYLQFVGPNLVKPVQTKVKKKTRNPVWQPEDVPIPMLQSRSLKRVEKETLMVAVFDYDFSTKDDPLGYAAIPLDTAAQYARDGQLLSEAEFKVFVTYKGVPAGTLEGSMKLVWDQNTETEQKCQAM